jgi:hypothetical protein
MTSPVLHSPVSIRISRPQLTLLVEDLHPLFWRMLATMCGENFFDTLSSDCDPSFLVICHHLLRQLWKRVDRLHSARKQTKYLLTLNVFEAGLCITAVRAAMRTKGTPTPASSIRNTFATRSQRAQLVQELENYERRLRRRLKRDTGSSSAKLLDQFAQYRKVVVHELFRPLPTLPRGLATLKRRLFQKLVMIAEDGLKETGAEIPPAKELRRMVGQWVQDVRRTRVDIGLPALLRDPFVGKQSLVASIRRKWTRKRFASGRASDAATVLSKRGELLRAVMDEVD